MAETTPDTTGTGAPISSLELAELKVDARRRELTSSDSLRLIAEVERLREAAKAVINAVDLSPQDSLTFELKLAAKRLWLEIGTPEIRT